MLMNWKATYIDGTEIDEINPIDRREFPFNKIDKEKILSFGLHNVSPITGDKYRTFSVLFNAINGTMVVFADGIGETLTFIDPKNAVQVSHRNVNYGIGIIYYRNAFVDFEVATGETSSEVVTNYVIGYQVFIDGRQYKALVDTNVHNGSYFIPPIVRATLYSDDEIISSIERKF